MKCEHIESRRHRGRQAMARAVAAVISLSVLGAVGVGVVAPAHAAPAVQSSPTSYVNTFIGTQDEGNTYPGATVPFGMVQLSPDTGHSTGYDYGQGSIRGFSLVHLSGVGCPLGGMLPVLPTTGEITSTDDATYNLGFDHSTEQSSPGYYKVDLNASAGPITAELSATTHTGVQRYTFPATTQANVMIDAGQSLTSVSHSTVTVVDDQTIDTAVTVHDFCEQTKPFTIHTSTHFSRPFASSGTWTGNTVSAGSASADSDDRTGAYARFDTTSDNVVEAVTSLSYVDGPGATANRVAEQAPFDTVRAAADATWNTQLSKIAVTSSDQTQLTTFYSALYRSFLGPNTGTDVDGRYLGWDQKPHTADGFTYYQNFSLWDTYRTQQQFLALMEPKRASDMAYSLVKQADQGGWAPRWSYGPVETNIMTGDPITPYLVSAWSQGLLKGHEDEAYDVLKQNADGVPPADNPTTGRAGNPTFNTQGYVPYDTSQQGKPGTNDMQNGGSAALEYALSDAMLSTMAKGLGHDADAARYAADGENYRAIFDSGTGAFRSRGANGLFNAEADPANAPGFHEGTAVQYEWLVPQDMPGLVQLFGGKQAAADKLDAFFAYDQLVANPADTARNVWVNGAYSYYNQDKYNPNNEPDLGSPYAYLWAGQPWKTTDVIRAALTLFTDGPSGVTGNDDMGEMSSWAVMSSIGLYPIVPGTNMWGLSTPVFSDVKITLDKSYYPAGSLHITAPGVSDAQHYEQSVSVNGANIDRGYLSGDELGKAGTIDYTVGSTPSSWATGADAAPAAVVTPTAAHRLTVGASSPSVAIAAGAQGAVTVQALAQGSGTISGTLTATGSDAVTVSGGGAWHVDANGASAQTDIPLALKVAPGTAPGSYPVHLAVHDDAGDDASADVTVVVQQESWLQSSFDNVGIGDRGAGNANFDSMGYYYLRDGLASVGMTQGQDLTVPGTKLHYVLGDPAPGQPDNLLAAGQTTDVRAGLTGATTVSFIGAANNGTQTADATFTYTDDSTSTQSITLTDWCSSGDGDNIPLPAPGERGDHSGTQSITCRLFSTAPVALPDGKSLQSITWPNTPKMHIFAIASNGTPAAPKADKISISGDARVAKTVTAAAPNWDVAGTATTYQWSLDGANIAGATNSTYEPASGDVGKELTVTATGRAAGYVPGTVTSGGLTVGSGQFSATTAPTIAGEPVVGGQLTLTQGTYSLSGAKITDQWRADGADIDGATGTTLTISAAQVGAHITVVETAGADGYDSVSQKSDATDAVAPAAPTTYTPHVHLSAGTVTAGSALTITGDGFAPGESVRIVLHSTPLQIGTATVDADGGLKTSVTVPADTVAGSHELEVIGDTSQASATAALTVTDRAGGDSAGTPGGGASTGLASTGLPENVWMFAALAVLLLAAGASAVLMRSRRRIGAHASTELRKEL